METRADIQITEEDVEQLLSSKKPVVFKVLGETSDDHFELMIKSRKLEHEKMLSGIDVILHKGDNVLDYLNTLQRFKFDNTPITVTLVVLLEVRGGYKAHIILANLTYHKREITHENGMLVRRVMDFVSFKNG